MSQETDYDVRIHQERQAAEALLPELDEAAETFMNATTEWLRNWWPEAARSAVTSNPDVARNELGSDGVAELKRSVSDLVSRANEIVREHLDSEAVWPHRGGVDALDKDALKAARGSAFKVNTWSGEQPLRDAVHAAAGQLGPILIEAGVAERYRTSPHTRGAWVVDVEGRATGVYPWAYGGDLPESVVEAAETYEENFKQLAEHIGNVNSLRAAKELSEAKQLWDDA